MSKLINKQKKKTWHWVNTAPKRIALIAAVAIMLLATACGVPEIREPVVKFMTEVYETFTEYIIKKNSAETEVVSQKYNINLLPNGFEEVDIYQDDITLQRIYENENGDVILFSQVISSEGFLSVDNEHTEHKVINVSDFEVYLFLNEATKQATWIQDNYIITIVCFGDFSEQDLIDLIELVELVE